MLYLVDTYNDKFNFITGINEEKCNEILNFYDEVMEVLEFYNMGKCV